MNLYWMGVLAFVARLVLVRYDKFSLCIVDHTYAYLWKELINLAGFGDIFVTGAFVPKKVFFTSGAGTSRDKLGSFEMALRAASIECYNLVTVSSILPPKCRIIPKEVGIKGLYPGSITFTVMSRLSSNESHRRISASVGMAIPEHMETEWGYFAEHHSFGDTKEETGDYAEQLANDMYVSISDKIPKKTMNVTETAVVGENGEWTTVLAAAVFLME